MRGDIRLGGQGNVGNLQNEAEGMHGSGSAMPNGAGEMRETGARFSVVALPASRAKGAALLLKVLGLGCRVGFWLLVERGLRGFGLTTPELALRLARRWLLRAAEARLLGEECRTRDEGHAATSRGKT